MSKEDLLKEVWEICTFDEIIDAGFEQNKCGAIDLKVAASEFDDIDHEIDDDEFETEIHNRGIREIVSILKNLYHNSDILDEFETEEILDYWGDEIWEYLKDTYTLKKHDEEIANQTYREYIDCWIEEIKQREKEQLMEVENYSPDELHQYICDILGVGYYDKERFIEKIKDKIKELKTSIYGEVYNEE